MGGSGLYALARFWFSVIISRMKNVLFRRGISAICAGILCASSAPAWGKSAKEVFAEVARSVVVVLALDSSGELSAQGSGVVVGKNEVATNCHVIEDAAKIVVRQAANSSGNENYRMSAEILTRDDERDLCLLFMDELSAHPAAPIATMGTAKGLTVGEDVYAVGAPEGLELSLSRGVVSQLRRKQEKFSAPLIQTDAAISPGSSGGGLFNEKGELVGITTFKWRGENLNFAIPVEWVENLQEKSQVKLAILLTRALGDVSQLAKIPEERHLYESAGILFQQRHYEDALWAFRAVLRFYPESRFADNARYWESAALFFLGRFEEAAQAARSLVKANPASDKSPDAGLLLARSLYAIGHSREARMILEQIIESDPTLLAADKARQLLPSMERN